MIEAGALAIIFWAYCGGLSVVAKSEHPVIQSPLFQLSSVTLYCALAGAVAWSFIHLGHPLMTIPALALVCILGVLLGSRYLAVLISDTVDRVHSAATGIGTMKVQPTYDQAAKAEHDGHLERALELYRQDAAGNPADPEPLRRMAEIRVRQGAVGDGIEILRGALGLVSEAEPKSTLAFRLADLLEREGRGGEARAVLESIERELSGTRFALYARERLASKRS